MTLCGGVGSSAREGEGPSCRPEKRERGEARVAWRARPKHELGKAGSRGEKKLGLGLVSRVVFPFFFFFFSILFFQSLF